MFVLLYITKFVSLQFEISHEIDNFEYKRPSSTKQMNRVQNIQIEIC